MALSSWLPASRMFDAFEGLAHGALQQLQLLQQRVDAEQRDGRASPNHGGRFPRQRTGEFLLAAEGNHERGIICAFHQYNGRRKIEIRWLGVVLVASEHSRGRRVLLDGYGMIRDSGGGPRLRFGDTGASKRGRDFRLLAHFANGRGSRAAGESDDLRGRKFFRLALVVVPRRQST